MDEAIQDYLLNHSIDDSILIRDKMELVKVTEQTTGEECIGAKISVMRLFPSLNYDLTLFYPLLDKINEYLAMHSQGL